MRDSTFLPEAGVLAFFVGDSSLLAFAAPRFFGVALMAGGDAISSVGSSFCGHVSA